jgi:protein disulfide-isomerase
MRFTSLALLFSAVALGSTQAIGAESSSDAKEESTTFNGKQVPPLLELTGDNFDAELAASRYLVVKYFRYVEFTPQLAPLADHHRLSF